MVVRCRKAMAILLFRFICRFGGRSARCGSTRSGRCIIACGHWISGIVAMNYFLCNISFLARVIDRNLRVSNLSRSGKDWSHRVKDKSVAILLGELLDQPAHFLADAPNHVCAVRIEIALCIFLRPGEYLFLFVELTGQLKLS